MKYQLNAQKVNILCKISLNALGINLIHINILDQ